MDIDKTLMTKFRQHAEDLRSSHAQRDADFELYDTAYLMKWPRQVNDAKLLSQASLTQSPDPHNQVKGAVRLMCVTDPQFNVSPLGKEPPDKEKVEQYVKRVWNLSGRRRGEPVHNALTFSAILYGEVHGGITPMQEMIAYLDRHKPTDERLLKYWTAQREQWEEAAATEQFLIDPWSPKGGYPEFSQLGLSAYHRQEEITVAQLFDRFGPLEMYQTARRTDPVTLSMYVDDVYTAYWTDEQDVFLDEHGYGFVPVMAQLIDGSNIFPAAEDRRQPMLYSMIKSGMWNAQNLALTVMFSAAMAMGSVTKFIYVPAVEGNRINLNWDEEIAYAHPGDQLVPIDMRNVLPPPLQEVYQLAVQKGYESTIYPAALGAPSEKATTYSEYALQSQAGRLPLAGPQHRGGWAISKLVELMLRIGRSTSDYLKGSGLTKADIPSGLMIDTVLEVKLPQERLQMANIGQMLNQMGVPNEWILENVIGINNPKQLRHQRWNEMAAEQMWALGLQNLLAQVQQAGQQVGPGMEQPMGGPAPQAGPMMAPGQAEQMQGIPPQMAGMMPGYGEAAVPQGMGMERPEEQMARSQEEEIYQRLMEQEMLNQAQAGQGRRV